MGFLLFAVFFMILIVIAIFSVQKTNHEYELSSHQLRYVQEHALVLNLQSDFKVIKDEHEKQMITLCSVRDEKDRIQRHLEATQKSSINLYNINQEHEKTIESLRKELEEAKKVKKPTLEELCQKKGTIVAQREDLPKTDEYQINWTDGSTSFHPQADAYHILLYGNVSMLPTVKPFHLPK